MKPTAQDRKAWAEKGRDIPDSLPTLRRRGRASVAEVKRLREEERERDGDGLDEIRGLRNEFDLETEQPENALLKTYLELSESQLKIIQILLDLQAFKEGCEEIEDNLEREKLQDDIVRRHRNIRMIYQDNEEALERLEAKILQGDS